MADWDSRVLVTGGAQGIGRAVAERVLRQGGQAVILDIDSAAGAAAEAALSSLGCVHFLHGNVAEERDVESAVAESQRLMGGLNGLVNNAGIMRRKPLAELSLPEWQEVLDTNLTAAMLCARAAAAALKAGGGAIVNVASTRAHMSEPHTEAYAAAKGGLLALTHALAVSLAPDVRVNAVSPGWIDVSAWRHGGGQQPLSETDHAQHPAGRVGRPEDVAVLAVYLLGPEAGFVTGAEFVVDGGMTRKMIYA